MGFKIAGYTKKSKMNLAGGGPKFASFAKSGDKIANLATLVRKRRVTREQLDEEMDDYMREGERRKRSGKKKEDN